MSKPNAAPQSSTAILEYTKEDVEALCEIAIAGYRKAEEMKLRKRALEIEKWKNLTSSAPNAGEQSGRWMKCQTCGSLARDDAMYAKVCEGHLSPAQNRDCRFVYVEPNAGEQGQTSLRSAQSKDASVRLDVTDLPASPAPDATSEPIPEMHDGVWMVPLDDYLKIKGRLASALRENEILRVSARRLMNEVERISKLYDDLEDRTKQAEASLKAYDQRIVDYLYSDTDERPADLLGDLIERCRDAVRRADEATYGKKP